MKNTRSGPISDAEREQYRLWGKMGGKKLAEERGSEHMRSIGALGAAATHGPSAEHAKTTTPRPAKAKPNGQRPVVQPVNDSLNDFI